MKKRLFVATCFLFAFFHLSSAQQDPLDSLKFEWKKYSKIKLTGLKDTIGFDCLMQIGRFYQSANIDSAFVYHNKAQLMIEDWLKVPALKPSDKARIQIRKGEIIRQKGWNNLVLGNMKLADSLFLKAIEHAKSLMGKNQSREVLYEAKRLHAAGLTNLASLYQVQGNNKIAVKYNLQAMKIAKEINNVKLISSLLSNIGLTYRELGDWKKAISYLKESLPLFQKSNNVSGEINTINNIGLTYMDKGKYPEALGCFFSGLKLAQKSKNIISEESVLNNIGNVYHFLDEDEKALAYCKKALACAIQLKNKASIGRDYLNIGVIYEAMGKPELAYEYYLKGLKESGAVNDKVNTAKCYYNIGVILEKKGDSKGSLQYYKNAVVLQEEVGDIGGLTRVKISMAESLVRLKQYHEAEKLLMEAEKFATTTDRKLNLRELYRIQSFLFDATNRPAKALQAFKMYIAYKDTLEREDNIKQSLKKELEFNYRKKATADSVANQKEKQIRNVEIARQKAELRAQQNLRYALYGGLILVILFALFMYNRFRLTKNQNKIIQEQRNEVQLQKEIIEEKHKEITDSINYAERIQKSFLATKTNLDTHLKDYFVLFKPKDVVSGDFYWSGNLKDGSFCLLVADSTGHGVPGAIMSILNITSIEKEVNNGETNPAAILNKTRMNIINRLKYDGSLEGGKDGMDCAILRFNADKSRLECALANNPLWLVRDNELIEYMPDKMPVGKHDLQNIPFKNHSIEIKKGDLIYVFTDGYSDQFGGPKGKKFKYANLKQLILNNIKKSMEDQSLRLNQIFEEWRGDIEQVDDVCVVGIRI